MSMSARIQKSLQQSHQDQYLMISRSERNLDVDVAGRNTTASIDQHKPARPKTSKETLKTTAEGSVMTPASQEGINLQWQTQQNSVAGLNFLIVTKQGFGSYSEITFTRIWLACQAILNCYCLKSHKSTPVLAWSFPVTLSAGKCRR